MKNKIIKFIAIGIILLLPMYLISCKSETSSNDESITEESSVETEENEEKPVDNGDNEESKVIKEDSNEKTIESTSTVANKNDSKPNVESKANKPSIPDGNIDLIISNVVQKNNVSSIVADKVQFVRINDIPGYVINGIDNKFNNYELSSDCKIKVYTEDYQSFKEISPKELSVFINDKLNKYPDVSRARLFKATVKDGKITQLEFIFTP